MNILFIDDEPAILRSIKRTLRGSLSKHHLDLVDNPQEVNEYLQRTHYELIVSDMRMPGKSGCHVLAEVEAQSPDTIRAILSGYSNEEQAVKAAQHAHLFLSKPFEPTAIVDLIQRAEKLLAMPLTDQLRRVLGNLKALAPAPKLFQTLTDTLNSNTKTATDIANIIKQDMAMATKLLQLTNSAFFGISQPVLDLERAVTLLGTEIIKGLILHYELFGKQQMSQPWQEALYRESQHTARLAKSIVSSQKGDRSLLESAFLAGLLHDTGRLVLWRLPEGAEHQDELFVALWGKELCEKELQLFGAHHGWVGAYLLRLWGFSDPVVEAVALHHHPSESGDRGFTALTAVHAADCLLHQADETTALDGGYLVSIGCAEALPEWRRLAQ